MTRPQPDPATHHKASVDAERRIDEHPSASKCRYVLHSLLWSRALRATGARVRFHAESKESLDEMREIVAFVIGVLAEVNPTIRYRLTESESDRWIAIAQVLPCEETK